MSSFTKYYESNKSENPYTMEKFSKSSRVEFLKYYIKNSTPENGKILDVGCGDMYLAKLFPEYDWLGLDVSVESNDGKAQRQDIEDTPYPLESESFDTIICSEVLEHVFDPLKVTKEINRLLKPGGTYILSTPNFDFIDHYISHFREVMFDVRKPWTKEHIHWYTVKAHAEILSLAGFTKYEYIGADPHYGVFFQEARAVLFTWLKNNFDNDDEKTTMNTDMLLSNMFKTNLHTIVVIAKKD